MWCGPTERLSRAVLCAGLDRRAIVQCIERRSKLSNLCLWRVDSGVTTLVVSFRGRIMDGEKAGHSDSRDFNWFTGR